MPKYVIYCPRWNCNPEYNKDDHYQIPHEQHIYTAIFVNDECWFKDKPNTGSSINAAYRRMNYMQQAHPCCSFEVVEV